jgi:hypothetical protein
MVHALGKEERKKIPDLHTLLVFPSFRRFTLAVV